MELVVVIGAVIGVVVGIAVGLLLNLLIGRAKLQSAQKEANALLEAARKDAEALKKEKLIEGENELLEKKKEVDRDINQKYDEQRKAERRLRDREVSLDKRYEKARQNEREIRDKEKELKRATNSIEGKEERLEELIQKKEEELERVAGMSKDEALELLKVGFLDKARRQTAEHVKEMRDKARLEANREAKELIVQAIQRSAADHASENTVAVVQLPNDDVKGRIIGREGRNIRAMEAATGVDIIVDDTPEAVILSSFDPYRREVARIALEKLISDGRIHPARIEEVVEKAQKELDDRVLELGRNAALEANVHGVHAELIGLLGRLH
ncbi:DUF3552 domain-containing protein, partial [bacterium]|nr:DUF3552 domain-containing protein [bacterium]